MIRNSQVENRFCEICATSEVLLHQSETKKIFSSHPLHRSLIQTELIIICRIREYYELWTPNKSHPVPCRTDQLKTELIIDDFIYWLRQSVFSEVSKEQKMVAQKNARPPITCKTLKTHNLEEI